MPLPSGTVTFLFTDIEGSTKLWEEHPQAMRASLARHDALLRQAIEDNSGVVFKTIGDAFCAAFATAPDALNAALAAQLALHSEAAPEPAIIKVRMALHTGMAELRAGDYFGQPLNRVARLLGAGHGGQTLLSDVAADLCADTLPNGVALQNMGTHALRDLGRPETVFQLLHAALPAEFPPLKTLATASNNLPQQLTSFIGREKERKEIQFLLDKCRLLTLLGAGGSGKTRLSLQVAGDVLEQFPDGVWLVELAPLADPSVVPQTAAQVLKVKEQGGQSLPQTLTDYLKSKKLLLLLDNCEHVLTACASLVSTLLLTCPNVKVLATSREPLGVSGEQNYPVPSLSVPNSKLSSTPQSVKQYEAVRLFIERARLVKPDFDVTDQNASALAQLCSRLDGIPLAIELAAARVRSLPVEEINARLDNCFRLLTGGSKTAMPRQQTLRALIDWSYNLLTSQEKILLSRLSVFAGGWTLAAAEQVGAGASEAGQGIEEWEALDVLTNLEVKSLVLAQVQEGATRYRLLETVRQYARERLEESGETHAIQAQHADYFLTLAENANLELHGPEQVQWLDILEEEHDNLRQALTLYQEDLQDAEENGGEDTHIGEKGLRLATALLSFWTARGHIREGRERLRVLLAHPRGQKATKARGDALHGAGALAHFQGDYNEARFFYEQSLAIQQELGNKAGIAAAHNSLGNVTFDQGDYETARALCEQSLAIRRELGDRGGIAFSLMSLGNIAMERGDYTQARFFYEQSLTIQQEMGNKAGIAAAHNSLGAVAHFQGDYNEARFFYEQSLAMWRELGDRGGIAFSLNNLGNISHFQGDYAKARLLLEESLAIHQELGNKAGIAFSLNNLGNKAHVQGDHDAARNLHEQSLAMRRELGDRVGIAFSLSSLGNIAMEQGDYTQARVLLEESLAIRQELKDKKNIAYCLESFASLAAHEAQEEYCSCLWGAASALRESSGSPLTPPENERQSREITRVQNALGEVAFAAAWAQGSAMTLDQAIEYAQEDKAV